MRHLSYVTVVCFRGVSAHGLEAAPTRRVLPIPRGQNKRIISSALWVFPMYKVQSRRFQSAARGIPRKTFSAYSLF